MKLFGTLSVLALVLSGATSYSQQMEAEVPGDNFSLEGALDLFKKSESPEHFERLLNSPDSKVNNLDLNGDGYIDYIRVFDRQDGNVHIFILQAVISERESQDVAVIELEKLSNGKAVLQIIGDEDVYGVETIIEPTSEVRTYAGTQSSTTIVNVWAWPVVRYVYAPFYTTWYSPWSWRVHPVWWSPWRPIAYVHYHPIYVRYRPHYSYCPSRRIAHAHYIYRPHRTTSVVVYNRHRSHIDHFRSTYRDGYASRSRREDRGSSYSGREQSSHRSRELYRNNSGQTRSSSRNESDLNEPKERIRTETSRDFARQQRTQRSDYQKTEFKRNEKVIERNTAPSFQKTTPSENKTRENRTMNRDFSRSQQRTTEAPQQRRQSGNYESRPARTQRQSTTPSMNRNTTPSMSRTPQRQESRQMDRVTIDRQGSSSRPSGQQPSNRGRSAEGRGNNRK